ncbi:MAG TPA: hypothetical protein GX497_09195 [Bacillus bacterium]|nr:hypothetical protein [Bacillus sp. (in: firmicutes)]
MKKYIVFLASFALFYFVLQILSGLILTSFYTPDFSSTVGSLSQEVGFGKTSTAPFLAILFTATLAYFFSQKLCKTAQQN